MARKNVIRCLTGYTQIYGDTPELCICISMEWILLLSRNGFGTNSLHNFGIWSCRYENKAKDNWKSNWEHFPGRENISDSLQNWGWRNIKKTLWLKIKQGRYALWNLIYNNTNVKKLYRFLVSIVRFLLLLHWHAWKSYTDFLGRIRLKIRIFQRTRYNYFFGITNFVLNSV